MIFTFCNRNYIINLSQLSTYFLWTIRKKNNEKEKKKGQIWHTLPHSRNEWGAVKIRPCSVPSLSGWQCRLHGLFFIFGIKSGIVASSRTLSSVAFRRLGKTGLLPLGGELGEHFECGKLPHSKCCGKLWQEKEPCVCRRIWQVLNNLLVPFVLLFFGYLPSCFFCHLFFAWVEVQLFQMWLDKSLQLLKELPAP